MNSGPDLTMAAVKMVLSLGLVLTILWLIYRWTRRTLPAGAAGAKGQLIKVLGSRYLGVKKSITVVKVPGSVLVLGIGNDRINLLTRIDDPEILASIEEDRSVQSGKREGFRDQLQRMLRPMEAIPSTSADADSLNTGS